MSFTPIETQEQLNEVIGERLRKAEEKAMAKAKEQFADYEDLKKQVTDFQEQIQKLTDTVSESEKKLADKDAELAESAKYKTDLEKTRIALQAGLKIDYADRLRGESAEEWKADAEALAKDFASSHVGAPLGSNEADITQESSARNQFAEWAKENFLGGN